VLIGLVTLLFVWVVLRFFMKRFVIKPISLIGSTAHQIGSGNLRARVQIPSRDELGQLAGQINEMANGLRERFELTKFVSAETLDAVRLSQEGIKLGGERRLRTLFFSDIRGFTAYAEKVEPEQVVAMLNTYLRAQTEIVRQYGGDIDKFVGDELVATFDDERQRGENMVVRAVRCAYAIQQRVGQLNREFPDAGRIAVGIGINTGPVVLGAMGSEARMDYTVIGDHVNTTARLCSAAGPQQILLSAASYEYLKGRADIQARQLAPLSVKNKSEPLIVYEVTHVELGSA
jgi:adenylate cyclase